MLDSAGYDKISIYIGIPFAPQMFVLFFYIKSRKEICPFVKDYIGALKEISGVGEILDSKGLRFKYL